jgi:zinc transport system permease protein
MIEIITDFFSYNFILYALTTGMCLGISCAFLGPFLVLKNLSLIGDGLSHVAFFAMIIGLMTGFFPLLISIIIVITSSLAILKITESSSIDGDSAIAMISAGALSLGIILINYSKGLSTDVVSFLFGSILFTGNEELFLAFLAMILSILWVYRYYYDLIALIYDEEYAHSLDIPLDRIKKILFILIGSIVAIGMRIIGALLITALIVFPTISALQISKTIKESIIFSCLFSTLAIFFGIFFSYLFDLPAGATIVLINILIFLIIHFFRKGI